MKGDWSERVGRVIEGVSWGSDRVRGRMITCEQAWVDELREMNSEDEAIKSNGINNEGVRGGANQVRADHLVMRMVLVPMME